MKKILALLLAVGTVAGGSMTALAAPAATELGFGEADGKTLEGGLLTPGEEYRFPLLITEDGKTSEFTDAQMEGKNLRLENTDGKEALENYKMVKVGNKYFFEVKVLAGWPTSQTDVSFKLRYQNKGDGKVVTTKEFSFNTGYAEASDGYISTLGEGDYIQVDNDAPVFTGSQLERISRINGYQKITFTGKDWNFSANVTDMENINMLSNTKAIPDIIEKFSTHDFKFVAFPAGPEFKGNTQLEIDVADIADDFGGNFFVYRYLNGKLTKVDFTYSSDDEAITIATGKLGRFVIADQEIADGTVIFGNGADNSSSSGSSSSSQGGGSTEKPNPDTGVGSGALIAAMSLVAAGAAGLATRKKR